MAFLRLLPAMALCALLANCVTTEQQLAERNNARCTARGLQPHTQNFNDCVTQLEGERIQRMETHRRDMMERPVTLSR